jgi:hypothetical protein
MNIYKRVGVAKSKDLPDEQGLVPGSSFPALEMVTPG